MSDLARFRGRHFLSTLDYSSEEIRAIVEHGLAIKRSEARARLDARVLGMLFFNPSVRTRVSCESAMARLGGHAIALMPGKDTWNFEHREGVVMDGDTQEHVRELAPVLSRMCHAIGIRKADLITTGLAQSEVSGDFANLRADAFVTHFAKFATVPTINLESNASHPLQGLADMATLLEKLKEPRGKKYVLTWAWHPKSLPVATPHSQLLAAADLGMEVVILRPEGWELDQSWVNSARRRAEALGGTVQATDDMEAAYRGAHVVCAKSWGARQFYGRFEDEIDAKRRLRAKWIVDEDKMARTEDALFMHCLPVRRNVIVTDGVLESKNSVVVDEAENRLWTVAGLLHLLIGT